MIFSFILMCMFCLYYECLHMYVRHMCACGGQRVLQCQELSYRHMSHHEKYLDPYSRLFAREVPVLLTAEPSLQPAHK